MRAALLLPLLLAALAVSHPTDIALIPADPTAEVILVGNDTLLFGNDTLVIGNDTIVIGNDTIVEYDGEHEPIIRKKRTFGDIVFRGLADALGYNVQRKPQQEAFPPPLAPVPGIDIPFQAAPAPPPPPPPPPPCGAPKPAPPPCRPPPPPPPPPCCKPPPPPPPPPPCCKPPPPPPPPPCKPPPPPPPPPCKPPPPPPPPPCKPPPPPPCAKPRGAPPCAPPPPPPHKDAADTLSSNLQLSFNFGRQRADPAPAPAADAVETYAPVAIEPRAARLPAAEPRTPRVYLDAFVVRDGVTHRVPTADAAQFDPQQDYLAYDDDEGTIAADDDDYEDVQESRDKTVQDVGNAVDKFWEKKATQDKKPKLPANHYKNVHFGDRGLGENIRRRSDRRKQSLQRSRNVQLQQQQEEDEESESTTTTEDPRRPLRPRVLPPTEQNPGQIDTVTVRVPPIYREKRPKKYNRAPDRDEETRSDENDADSEGEYNIPTPFTEPPRQQRRRKKTRRTRSAKAPVNPEDDPFAVADYDYYGKKIPVSEEEQFYRQLRIPEPSKDEDLARVEEEPSGGGQFLDDHERLVEDPERVSEDERIDESGKIEDDSGHADDSGRADERERLVEDPERTNEGQRADSKERTDELSPHAKVRETGYSNNYLRATNLRVHNPRHVVQRT